MKILHLIAKHFLKEFSSTGAISRYSPKVSEIVLRSQHSFPKINGGFYQIQAEHFIDAAIALGIPVGSIKGNELIAISAQQFNSKKVNLVFSSDLTCIHGFVPVGFTFDEKTQQLMEVPRCPRCANGLENPTTSDIEAAVHWLQTSQSKQTIGAGALILAARQLELQIIKNLNGTFHIQKKKKGGNT